MVDVEIIWNPNAMPSDEDESCVRLRAYRSPKDKVSVVGYYEFNAQTASDQVTFVKSPYGTLFTEAYQDALEFAANNAIPKLIIDDPDGLGQAVLEEGG